MGAISLRCLPAGGGTEQPAFDRVRYSQWHGQRDLAIQEFQRAQELDRHNVAALLGMADTFSKLGRSQEAEELYKHATALRPELWDGYYRLGAFYYDQGQFPEAADQFRRVIQLLPDHADAHTGLGTTLLALGRTNRPRVSSRNLWH